MPCLNKFSLSVNILAKINYGTRNYFKLDYYDCIGIPESDIQVITNQILITYSVDPNYIFTIETKIIVS